MTQRALISAALLLALFAAMLSPAFAVGVVTDCNDDTEFSSLLSGGSTVTFNCSGVGAAATVTLSSTKIISANTIIDGGGKITLSGGGVRRLFFVNAGVTLTLTGLTLIGGSEFEGATIYNLGTLRLRSSTIMSGTATSGHGGAVKSLGTIIVVNSLFRDNASLLGYGGAIDSVQKTSLVSITNSMFINNTSKIGGGAIASNGFVQIDQSTFMSNSTESQNASSGGGAIENTGSMTITASTFNANQAGKGGAVYNEGGTALIINSTFSSNTVNVAPYTGGAIHNQLSTDGLNTPGAVTLIASTVAGNAAASGTGGNLNNNSGNTLRVKLSIVTAGNPNNCAGTIVSQGNNLESANTCSFASADDLVNANPLLGPLADNNGPTWTHALLAGSAAVDHVISGCTDQQGSPLAVDQRGVTRPQGLHCDVGAFEVIFTTQRAYLPLVLK